MLICKKMKITYFYRNSQCGFSIQHVFQTLIKEIGKYVEVEEIFMPAKRAGLWDVIKNIYYAFRHRNKNGINHITGDVYYLCWILKKRNLVVTVHDIWFYVILDNALKKKIKYFIYLLPLKRASKIVFISETTKRQVLEHIKLKEEKIVVINNPVSTDFQESNKMFNKEKPTILHLGMSPSKNLVNLIPALYGINCHFRLIGTLREEYKQLLEKYQIDYSCASNLINKQIVEEYNNCDIVNLSSQHEGFGMPIIEGQATCKPVVTSNILPMCEIAGEGAILVNPYDQQEISNAYNKIINDDNYRESIRHKGFENAKRFSVEKISSQYLDVYINIMK